MKQSEVFISVLIIFHFWLSVSSHPSFPRKIVWDWVNTRAVFVGIKTLPLLGTTESWTQTPCQQVIALITMLPEPLCQQVESLHYPICCLNPFQHLPNNFTFFCPKQFLHIPIEPFLSFFLKSLSHIWWNSEDSFHWELVPCGCILDGTCMLSG